jgi:hypothetical protein
VVTQTSSNSTEYSHVTTGAELTEGRHYWELEILHVGTRCQTVYVGVSRPDLDPVGDYVRKNETHGGYDGWFVSAYNGSTYNGQSQVRTDPTFKSNANPNLGSGQDGGHYNKGDRMGVLLDLDDGSLRFFKNGVPHDPGFPLGSVTGPVVVAVELGFRDQAVRLHADVALPAGYVQ